jgi:putative endonuclease
MNSGGSGWRIELGRVGESKAVAWLQQKGWRIKDTNWRSGRYGEIDIIAEDLTRTLVFVEVKTRFLSRIEHGFRNTGFESVNGRKRMKMNKLALSYIAFNRLPNSDFRFDVIVVEYHSAPESKHHSAVTLKDIEPVINHVEAAFG